MKHFDCIVCRYGELGLKGENRVMFEKQLVRNIGREIRKREIDARVLRVRGRIIVYSNQDIDFLKTIFGIVSFSRALEIKSDIDVIKKAIEENVSLKSTQSFRITVKRLEKNFSQDTLELQKDLGAFVVESKKAKVSLKEFDKEICVEFFNGKAYLFTEKILGMGGLPSGIEGKAFIKISNEKDLLAALLMMKRGCTVYYELESKKFDAVIEKFSNGNNLISGDGSKADVVVLSETLEDMEPCEGFVLRPLIAFDEEEITEKLKRFMET